MKNNCKKKILLALLFEVILNAVAGYSQSNENSILKYNVKGDGLSDNTFVIQQAIDRCSESGGGTLFFPPGIYLSGTLFLKDHVCLYLDKSAVLKGIILDDAYPTTLSGNKGFIRIDNASNVTIRGEGIIDGSGENEIFKKGDNGPGRPVLVECFKSNNVSIKDVRLQNSAEHTLVIYESNNVTVDGVQIHSHCNLNNDGIDIDSKNVLVSNCLIDSDDDALCFKSDGKNICENVVVNNCILASNCNLIKFGTGSVSGFRNISISNCVLHSASESNFRNWNKIVEGITDSITGISGIALEVVDGGIMDQITINNISMTGIQTPIFMRLGSRKNPTGSLENILISNIVASAESRLSSCITGVPGFNIENVIIRDLIVNYKGGGTSEDFKRDIPENEKGYPENRMFGNSLPAYGMYVRHAQNIFLDNLQFILNSPDYRPALMFDDAKDITVRSLRASSPRGDQSLIVKKNSIVKLLK